MFANLHTHTEYSLLDGLSKIPALLDRARELGQTAMAITDHGAMYGVIEFYQQAKKREMKPLIGLEGYVAPNSRHSRDPREKTAYYHLTLLARNYEGYKNLMALTTLSNLEGYYYKPRMDREILEKYGEGIIALSGCPSGEVFKALLDNDQERAKKSLDFFKGVFDDVYLEIQDHPDAKGELRGMLDAVNPRLIELSKYTGLPLVATNDSHYTMPEDAYTHEVLLCIGTSATMQDPKRFRLEGDSYYVKSEAEMLKIFDGLDQAVANTMLVADACDLSLDFGRINMPEPELPPGKSPQEHLADVCRAGLVRRYGNPSDEHIKRLEYELEVIEITGFASYMLIVAEIARAAVQRRIPMGVRGSAAASIVLYCLGVTDIDPIATRLVFERFLNVERREMPDVDLDFADDRRGEMIKWAAERYGHDRVAQIITFGTLGAKAAIRDTGRALGMTLSDTDRVARMIPTALHMTIDRAITENAEFKQAYDADPNVRKLVDTAKKLEGVARNAGTHAAGVVISGTPLIELVPLQKPARGDESALPVTQFEMGTVAEVGLLKMDFLGLSNLTILARALDLIKEQRGIDIDLKTLPDGDEKTYELLSRGETFAVFQLESAGMRRYIQELKPSSIAELSAMVALYRPGPMQHIPRYCNSKHGKEPISYPHPDLANILDETYGIIVYQDQVLFILRQFAGYTMGEADKVRKAMGKKIAEMMKAEREKFIKGAKKQGYSEADANAVFDMIEPFAGYAFNKAHSVCYGTIAYQTAWLKANYPAEYMTAVLSLADSHPSGFAERVGAAVSECAKLGISVLPPSVNHSDVSFSVEGGGDGGAPLAIRFGLATIKNVGTAAVEGVVAARREGGPYQSLEDFCRRAAVKGFNKRTLESLIKAGALDCFEHNRTTLAANLDRIASLIQREQRLKESGQSTMFDLFGDEVSTPLPALELEVLPYQQGECLTWEKDLLGVYVSEHPYRQAHASLATRITAVVSEVTEEMAGRELAIAGMVASVRTLLTKAGKTFAAAVIEDLSGSVEVTCWPDVYEKTKEQWQQGKILLLSVRVRQRDERLDVTVNDVGVWDEHTSAVLGGASIAAPAVATSVNGAGPHPNNPPADDDGWSAYPPGEEEDDGEWGILEPAAPRPVARPFAEPAGVMAGAAASTGNGHLPARVEGQANGNGHTPTTGATGSGNGKAYRNGYGRNDPPPAPIPTSDRDRRLLRITLNETTDEPEDRRRLNELVQVLRSLPGPDEVRLILRTAHDQYTLNFGTALVTDGIEQRLGPVLNGWGDIEVEPIRPV